MATDGDTELGSTVKFTLEEQWAIHQAFLDYIERAVKEDTELSPPAVEIAILEKIEDDDFTFTEFELDRLRYECEHLVTGESVSPIDRESARSVVKKIDRQCSAHISR